jgi:predicted ATPase
VRLFVARAQAVNTAFTLTDENGLAVTEICRRLDGLPLAIELVTARCRHFTPQALLALLDSRLTLLTSGSSDFPKRQQSLRGLIDWSYNLLERREQRLLACMGSSPMAARWRPRSRSVRNRWIRRTSCWIDSCRWSIRV